MFGSLGRRRQNTVSSTRKTKRFTSTTTSNDMCLCASSLHSQSTLCFSWPAPAWLGWLGPWPGWGWPAGAGWGLAGCWGWGWPDWGWPGLTLFLFCQKQNTGPMGCAASGYVSLTCTADIGYFAHSRGRDVLRAYVRALICFGSTLVLPSVHHCDHARG